MAELTPEQRKTVKVLAKSKKLKLESVVEAQVAFAQFDTNGDGEIDKGEARNLINAMRQADSGNKKIKEMTESMVDRFVSHAFAEYDANKDGSLQFAEFLSMYADFLTKKGISTVGDEAVATGEDSSASTSTTVADASATAAAAAKADAGDAEDGEADAEAKAKADAEAEAAAKAEEEAKAEAEAAAKAEAEAVAKAEAEAAALADAEAKVQADAEAAVVAAATATDEEAAAQAAAVAAVAAAASAPAAPAITVVEDEAVVPLASEGGGGAESSSAGSQLRTSPAKSPAVRLLEKGRSDSIVNPKRKQSVLFTRQEESAWSLAISNIQNTPSLQKGRSHEHVYKSSQSAEDAMAELSLAQQQLPFLPENAGTEIQARVAGTPLAHDEVVAEYLVHQQRTAAALAMDPRALILADVLTFETSRNVFRDALVKAMCVENLDFYYGVQLVRHRVLSGASHEELAALIAMLRPFLEDDAVSVNVSAAAKLQAVQQMDILTAADTTPANLVEKLEATSMENAIESIFKKAEHQVYQNMTSSFASFFDASPVRYFSVVKSAVTVAATEFSDALAALVAKLKEHDMYDAFKDILPPE